MAGTSRCKVWADSEFMELLEPNGSATSTRRLPRAFRQRPQCAAGSNSLLAAFFPMFQVSTFGSVSQNLQE